MSWRSHALHAARAAARLRADFGIGPADAVCPVDICARLGVDVWYQANASLEGIYFPGEPCRIVVSSLRPAGRQRNTTGHELGHHIHKHGASLDAQLGGETKLEEYVANAFGHALLMPQLVVTNAFTRRGWSARSFTAEQAFVVAQDLGVGFTSLLQQMSGTLRLIDRTTANTIGGRPLPKLRAALMGVAVEHDLFPIDQHWGARPLDLEIGDVIAAPSGSHFEGECAAADGNCFHATRAGVGSIAVPHRAEPISVRVSRRGFVGQARYRHLEDPDDT